MCLILLWYQSWYLIDLMEVRRICDGFLGIVGVSMYESFHGHVGDSA